MTEIDQETEEKEVVNTRRNEMMSGDDLEGDLETNDCEIGRGQRFLERENRINQTSR